MELLPKGNVGDENDGYNNDDNEDCVRASDPLVDDTKIVSSSVPDSQGRRPPLPRTSRQGTTRRTRRCKRQRRRRRPLVLYHPGDRAFLTDLMCFVRLQIELFVDDKKEQDEEESIGDDDGDATTKNEVEGGIGKEKGYDGDGDIDKNNEGKKTRGDEGSIYAKGRVGLRCVHCHASPFDGEEEEDDDDDDDDNDDDNEPEDDDDDDYENDQGENNAFEDVGTSVARKEADAEVSAPTRSYRAPPPRTSSQSPSPVCRRAIVYPTSTRLVYQSVRNWQRHHMMSCPCMPPDVRHRIVKLKAESRNRRSSKASGMYWVRDCARLGLVDVPVAVAGGQKQEGAGANTRLRLRKAVLDGTWTYEMGKLAMAKGKIQAKEACEEDRGGVAKPRQPRKGKATDVKEEWKHEDRNGIDRDDVAARLGDEEEQKATNAVWSYEPGLKHIMTRAADAAAGGSNVQGFAATIRRGDNAIANADTMADHDDHNNNNINYNVQNPYSLSTSLWSSSKKRAASLVLHLLPTIPPKRNNMADDNIDVDKVFDDDSQLGRTSSTTSRLSCGDSFPSSWCHPSLSSAEYDDCGRTQPSTKNDEHIENSYNDLHTFRFAALAAGMLAPALPDQVARNSDSGNRNGRDVLNDGNAIAAASSNYRASSSDSYYYPSSSSHSFTHHFIQHRSILSCPLPVPSPNVNDERCVGRCRRFSSRSSEDGTSAGGGGGGGGWRSPDDCDNDCGVGSGGGSPGPDLVGLSIVAPGTAPPIGCDLGLCDRDHGSDEGEGIEKGRRLRLLHPPIYGDDVTTETPTATKPLEDEADERELIRRVELAHQVVRAAGELRQFPEIEEDAAEERVGLNYGSPPSIADGEELQSIGMELYELFAGRRPFGVGISDSNGYGVGGDCKQDKTKVWKRALSFLPSFFSADDKYRCCKDETNREKVDASKKGGEVAKKVKKAEENQPQGKVKEKEVVAEVDIAVEGNKGCQGRRNDTWTRVETFVPLRELGLPFSLCRLVSRLLLATAEAKATTTTITKTTDAGDDDSDCIGGEVGGGRVGGDGIGRYASIRQVEQDLELMARDPERFLFHRCNNNFDDNTVMAVKDQIKGS